MKKNSMPNPVKSHKFSDFVEELNSNKEKQKKHISSSTKMKNKYKQRKTVFYKVSITLMMMVFKKC